MRTSTGGIISSGRSKKILKKKKKHGAIDGGKRRQRGSTTKGGIERGISLRPVGKKKKKNTHTLATEEKNEMKK